MEYHAMQFEKTWIRVAGIAQRIRDLEPPPHWRFQVAGSLEQHQINDWHLVEGVPTSRNNQPGTNPEAKEPDFLAWVAYYVEKININERGHAAITLGEPSADKNNPWKPTK
jgi:hypothetical protein